MIATADKFVVQYLAGLSGTMLTWFVNQHAGFPNINVMHNEDNDVALASYATSWVLNDTVLADDDMYNQDIVDVELEIKQCLEDPHKFHRISPFDKIAIKTFPHDIINDPEDEVISEHMVKKITDAGFNRWIYPFIYDDQGDYNVKQSLIHRRWNSLKNRGERVDYNLASEKMYECNTLETDENDFFKHIVEKYNITVHRVDISLLVAGDQSEYNRLLTYIDSEPLLDWHQRITKWAAWVGYRYVEV